MEKFSYKNEPVFQKNDILVAINFLEVVIIERIRHISNEDRKALRGFTATTLDKPKKKKRRRKRPTLLKFCTKHQKYTHVLDEWDYEKNVGLTPGTVTAHSGKKVRWKCEKGHCWQTYIMHRTRPEGSSCPYCAGRKTIPGETDLFSLYPYLQKEWDYEKNTGIDAEELRPHARKKVWWKCKKGHCWQAVIGDRVNGSGCPYCAGNRKK